MKVKELLKKLIDMDPEATVCVEVLNDNAANVVKQYHTQEGNMVYIADDTEYLDKNAATVETTPYEKTSFLSLFIEQEIPFRLKENFGIHPTDPEQISADVVELIIEWFEGHSDVLFDYDAIDDKITEFLDAFSIHYGDEDEDEDEQEQEQA